MASSPIVKSLSVNNVLMAISSQEGEVCGKLGDKLAVDSIFAKSLLLMTDKTSAIRDLLLFFS